MLVILPDDTDGLKQLEDSISHVQIWQWRQNLNEQSVLVSMPKFQISEKHDLKEPLKSLGMSDVFDPENADLGGIADISLRNLHLTSTTQDAFIDVNEEGTEVASVTTSLSSTGESVSRIFPAKFIADHPFLFIIQEDWKGTILFMGKISDP